MSALDMDMDRRVDSLQDHFDEMFRIREGMENGDPKATSDYYKSIGVYNILSKPRQYDGGYDNATVYVRKDQSTDAKVERSVAPVFDEGLAEENPNIEDYEPSEQQADKRDLALREQHQSLLGMVKSQKFDQILRPRRRGEQFDHQVYYVLRDAGLSEIAAKYKAKFPEMELLGLSLQEQVKQKKRRDIVNHPEIPYPEKFDRGLYAMLCKDGQIGRAREYKSGFPEEHNETCECLICREQRKDKEPCCKLS